MSIFGIPNMGNTCFMAATLQMLMSSEKIFEKLKKSVNVDDKKYSEYFANFSKNRRHTISFFMDAFENYRKSDGYEKGKQADAALFLSMITDDLPDAFEKIEIDRVSFLKEEHSLEYIRREMGRGDFAFYKEVVNYLPGVVDTIAEDRKKTKMGSYSEEISDMIVLNIEQEGFTQGLGNFIIEDFDSRALIKSFKKLPDDLFISLKRFEITERGHRKIDREFFMPELIYMQENEKQVPYKMKSVVVQRGSLSGGHYICYRLEGGNWYICNDEKIEQVRNPPLNEGYIYLYQRESQVEIETFDINYESGSESFENFEDAIENGTLEHYVKSANFSRLLNNHLEEVLEKSVKMQTELGDRIFKSVFRVLGNYSLREELSEVLSKENDLYTYLLDGTIKWRKTIRQERDNDIFRIYEGMLERSSYY